MIAETFAALARRPLWLCWKTEQRNGKPTKVPYTIDGRAASATDPQTWSTLAEAERAAPHYDGLGIALAPLDESHHLGGVDLDACIDDEGDVAPWAREIVELLASYTEVSPSGHGLKVFFTYDPRTTAERRWRSSAKRQAINGGKDSGIEFYLKGRYFTVTGSLFECFDAVRQVSLEELLDIQQRMDAFAPTRHAKEQPDAQRPHRPTDKHDIALQCLAHIPNDGAFVARDAWLEIGMTLHDATGGSAAGQLAWASWTAQQHANAQEACDAAWSSFKTGGGCTLGTLVELARRRGFDPYERKSRTTANGHTQGQRADGDPGPEEPDHGSGTADPEQPQITATPYRWRAAKAIPPREWLYDRHYIRQFLSCSVSASGVGKSSVSILDAVGMAVGRNLLTGDEFPPLRTWYWNGEDPHEELERRVQAVCLHYGITENDLGGRFFLDSGRNQRIKIVQQLAQRVRINRPVVSSTIETLKANGIDAVTFDPFISTQSVPENDNTAIDQVASEMADIADAAKCAVEAVHHVRKTNGAEITAEDARGGSALVAKGRSVRVFNTMTVDEAPKAGINVNERRLYFRSENGKGNMVRPASTADWRRLTSVLLGNGTSSRPSDDVGVVTAWKWPDAFAGLTADDLKTVQNKVGGGEWRADPRADAWVGHAVAKVLSLDVSNEADGSRIKELLKGWLKSGALKKSDRIDPDTRKKRMFVEVGTWV